MKKNTLIAAAFAAISTVAMAGSPAFATAVSPAQATAGSPAYADLLPSRAIGGIGSFNKGPFIEHPRKGFIGGRKVGPRLTTPKVCYERKRVGPQTYVTVRRPC